MSVMSAAANSDEFIQTISDFADSIKYGAYQISDLKELKKNIAVKGVISNKMAFPAACIVNFLRYVSERTGAWIGPTQRAISVAFFDGTVGSDSVGKILSRLRELGIIRIKKNHGLNNSYLIQYNPENSVLDQSLRAITCGSNKPTSDPQSLEQPSVPPALPAPPTRSTQSGPIDNRPRSEKSAADHWNERMPYHMRIILENEGAAWIQRGFKCTSEQAPLRVLQFLRKRPDELEPLLSRHWQQTREQWYSVLSTLLNFNVTSDKRVNHCKQFVEAIAELPDEYLESLSEEERRKFPQECDRINNAMAKYCEFLNEYNSADSSEKRLEVHQKYVRKPVLPQDDQSDDNNEPVPEQFSVPEELLSKESARAEFPAFAEQPPPATDMVNFLEYQSRRQKYLADRENWVEIVMDERILAFIMQSPSFLATPDQTFLNDCKSKGLGKCWEACESASPYIVMSSEKLDQKTQIEEKYSDHKFSTASAGV